MPVFIVVLLAFDKRNLYHKKQYARLMVKQRDSGRPQGSFVGGSEGHKLLSQGFCCLTDVSGADPELDLLIKFFSTFGRGQVQAGKPTASA